MSDNLAAAVAVGTDGYLYLVGGAQRVLDYVTGAEAIPDQAFQRFEANLRSRNALATAIGAKYQHCVCPDKHSVIPEKFPFTISSTVGARFADRCGIPFMYPIERLRSCEQTFGYLKTDTHWNFLGRFAVVQAVMGGFGASEDLISSRTGSMAGLKKSYSTYCGDLGNKLTPRPSEQADVSADLDSFSGVRSYSNKISGNNGLIVAFFNCLAGNNSRLLVFGDSFMYHCMPMLSLFFKETLFLRSPYLHREIVEGFEPSHLLTSNAERYLPNTVNDIDAPLGLLLAGLSGKVWNCDPLQFQAINAALQPKGPHNRNFWSLLRQAESVAKEP